MAMSFKKKQQSPMTDLTDLLGLAPQPTEGVQTITSSLILKSAMFWDSKKRVERIKSLVLSGLNLKEFRDSEDFTVADLISVQLLSLSKNSITHLQPISCLQTLVSLNFNNNRVYDLSPLTALTKLEELYANNNEISDLVPLVSLKCLRIVQLFRNKVRHVPDVTNLAESLKDTLDELDIEENPAYSDEIAREILVLVPALRKLNNKPITRAERERLAAPTLMSASMIIEPENVSCMMRSTVSSFKTFRTQSVTDDLAAQFARLQEEYTRIDDQFEDEIARNVSIKGKIQAITQKAKKIKTQNEQFELSQSEAKQLARKVAALKESLFKPTRKGELLKLLFEKELRKQHQQKTHYKVQKGTVQQNKGSMQQNKAAKSHLSDEIWQRVFDYDEIIVIDNNFQEEEGEVASRSREIENMAKRFNLSKKQPQKVSGGIDDQDAELLALLEASTSALSDLKRELAELGDAK